MEEIKDHLEIVIITYNRASLLQNTLHALNESPFRACKITILNNASTDDTLKVCDGFLDEFPDLTITTNKVNIGANANIMRALETSNGNYTWILCDDDKYDFSDCDDFIEAVINEKAELIHVGANADVPWSFGGNLDIPRNLLKLGYPFFSFSSFVPCNVFKTKSFYLYIISGYNNIVNSYPHMPFFISFFELNKPVYVVKHRVVEGRVGAQNYSYNNFFIWWLNTSLLLKTRKERSMMFIDPFRIKFSRKVFLFHIWSMYTIIRVKEQKIKHYDIFGAFPFLYSLVAASLCYIYFRIRE